MSRAIFFSLPASGHVNPSLPLVSELVKRGDRIVYYATQAFREKVERTGAEFRPYVNAFLQDLSVLPARLQELSWLMARTTTEILEVQLAEFRDVQPDYVIADSLAPWGQWVVQILAVPAVTSISTMAFNRHVLRFAAQHKVQPKSVGAAATKARAVVRALVAGRRLRRLYGVAGPGMMSWVSGSSALNIVYTSRYFQPCSDTFDSRYLFVGPSIGDRGSDSLPLQSDVIYVSLGTLFNTDSAFYRTCFEALRGEPCRIVLSVGAAIDMSALGSIPENFMVRAHVPQLEVLARTKVFVTHGGMNSVSESLYFGVPMVVIPQMSEQEIVARRVEQLGACLFLTKSEVTADRLRRCVRSVAGAESFRTAAAAVRESFLQAGGVQAAADAIFTYTGR